MVGCRRPKERAHNSSFGILARILISDDDTASAGTHVTGVGGTASTTIVPARSCGLACGVLHPTAARDISGDGPLADAVTVDQTPLVHCQCLGRFAVNGLLARRIDGQFNAPHVSKEQRVSVAGIGYSGQVCRADVVGVQGVARDSVLHWKVELIDYWYWYGIAP